MKTIILSTILAMALSGCTDYKSLTDEQVSTVQEFCSKMGLATSVFQSSFTYKPLEVRCRPIGAPRND